MKDIEAADTYMERLLEFCPKIGRAHIQSRLDGVAAERAREEHGSRRNSELARLLEEAKRRDEEATEWALEEAVRAVRATEAEIIAREEAAKEERERVTLGGFYPAFAPGCWKTRMTSDWYDDDRWEKVEENYSADRRLAGLYFWNRGLAREEHYGAGRFSSLMKSAEEYEVTRAEANRAAKTYKRRKNPCTTTIFDPALRW
tara:strand:- start:156 stop:761 length:606 start_codon:yes stop_codon:yes gene_type:complete